MSSRTYPKPAYSVIHLCDTYGSNHATTPKNDRYALHHQETWHDCLQLIERKRGKEGGKDGRDRRESGREREDSPSIPPPLSFIQLFCSPSLSNIFFPSLSFPYLSPPQSLFPLPVSYSPATLPLLYVYTHSSATPPFSPFLPHPSPRLLTALYADAL